MKKVIYQFSYRLDIDGPGRLDYSPSQLQYFKDTVIDCRVIPNPYSLMKTEMGRANLVRNHPMFLILVSRAIECLENRGGVVHIGCDYGRHRSGAVAEEVHKRTGIPIIQWRERNKT